MLVEKKIGKFLSFYGPHPGVYTRKFSPFGPAVWPDIW